MHRPSSRSLLPFTHLAAAGRVPASSARRWARLARAASSLVLAAASCDDFILGYPMPFLEYFYAVNPDKLPEAMRPKEITPNTSADAGTPGDATAAGSSSDAVAATNSTSDDKDNESSRA